MSYKMSKKMLHPLDFNDYIKYYLSEHLKNSKHTAFSFVFANVVHTELIYNGVKKP